MIRSKIDEIRLLRTTNFKRPTTSSYLSNNRNVNVQYLNRHNNAQYARKPVADIGSTAKTPNSLKVSTNFTPESSKSHLMSTLTFSSKTPSKLRSSFPYPSQDFLNKFKSLLNKHEAIEILDYFTVYYWGKSEKSGHLLTFNDENGYFLCWENDHIAYKYQIIRVLGKGNFGQVFEALDHKDKSKVAIKIVKSHKKFMSQAHNEINILKILRDSAVGKETFCVELKDYFVFRGHICIVTELLGQNLLEVIKSEECKGDHLDFVRGVTGQILEALKVLRKLRIIHCDLKPENVLRFSSSQVKVADFGSSCLVSEKYFGYIQSRNYRSPEVVLGCPFDYQIDIWSLGCVVFELVTGDLLFKPSSELELLHQIQFLRGEIPSCLLQTSSKYPQFFTSNTLIPLLPNPCSSCSCSALNSPFQALPNDPLLLDFLQSCLTIDPKSRITANQALSHPWIHQTVPPKTRIAKHLKLKPLITPCL